MNCASGKTSYATCSSRPTLPPQTSRPWPGCATRIREALRHGSATTKKVLLQALVAEIRVMGRHQVKPWFRVPNIPTDANTPTSGGVRTLSSEVGGTYPGASL